MRPGKLFVALIGWALAASPGLGQDKGWVVVHYDPHMEVWVRPPVGAAARPGSIWVQAQYSPRQRLNGFKYASERYLAQVDCGQGTINRLQWQQFFGPHFDGKSRPALINSGVAWAIVPDSVDDWVAKAVCGETPKR
jgi:hypothetical protein